MANIGKNVYGGENTDDSVEWRKRNDPSYFQAFQNLYQGGDPSKPLTPAAGPMPQSPSAPPAPTPLNPNANVPPAQQGVPRPTFQQPQARPRPTPGASTQAGNTSREAVDRRFAAMAAATANPASGGPIRNFGPGAGTIPPQTAMLQTAEARRGNRVPGDVNRDGVNDAQDAGYRLFGRDAGDAASVANEMFRVGGMDEAGSLGRLNSDPSREMRGAVDDYQRVANQYAQGGRTNAQQQAIDRMSGIANQYQGGGRSGDMGGVLAAYQQNLQGYSGQEGQAMREQAERGLDRQSAQAARNIQSAARRNRLSGAAQTAQLGDVAQNRFQAQSDIETNLAVRGADERRRALDSYAGRLGTQEQAEYQRQLESAQASGQYLSGQEDREFGRMREAQDARLAALRGMEGDTRDSQKYNLGQQAAEKAGQVGTYFGSMDVAHQRQEADRANRLNERALRAYERELGIGGRDGDRNRDTPPASRPDRKKPDGSGSQNKKNKKKDKGRKR